MTSALATRTREAPAPTLIGAGGRRTGSDLVHAVDRSSGRLHDVGLRAGDRVLLRGDNSPEYVTTLLALARLDTSVVLVDACQTPDESRACAARTAVRWVLHDGDDPGVPGATAVSYPDLSPPLDPPSPADRAAGQSGGRPAGSAGAWWRRPDAAILWSSGATGPAKAVVKSGWSILDNTLRTRKAMGYRATDVLAPWLPFSHQHGMSMVLLWWLTGATLLISPYRQVHRAVVDAAQHRATVVDAAPASYHALVHLVSRRPDLADRLRSVRLWSVGGAPLPAPLADAFRARLGAPLLDGYGLTEVGNVALATAGNPVGCGQPLPGVYVRISDAAGRPAAAGVPGEIEVRSPGLMTGYLGSGPGAVYRPPGRWYRTRDLGYLDRAGNLHVLGRLPAPSGNGTTPADGAANGAARNGATATRHGVGRVVTPGGPPHRG
jgi:acyl-CoA synthetase (AMP-forming)/AMP-acid ligase II